MSEEAVRYVVVDAEQKRIVDGPSLWVGEPEWQHPLGEWMPEADALADGYEYPPPPVFEPPADEPPADDQPAE